MGEIRDLVRHLKDRGIGVLITDHNVRDALDVIDRAYILHDGRVLKEGIGEDFIPKTFNRQVVDEMVRVNDKESFNTARQLAREQRHGGW